MKLKQRASMTAVEAYVYGSLGAVSMSSASADKRFRAQLKEGNVVVAGLIDGERRHMHLLAQKYRRQIRGEGREIKSKPIRSGDRRTSHLLHWEQ